MQQDVELTESIPLFRLGNSKAIVFNNNKFMIGWTADNTMRAGRCEMRDVQIGRFILTLCAVSVFPISLFSLRLSFFLFSLSPPRFHFRTSLKLKHRIGTEVW